MKKCSTNKMIAVYFSAQMWLKTKWGGITITSHFKSNTVYVTVFKLKVPTGLCAVLQP